MRAKCRSSWDTFRSVWEKKTLGIQSLWNHIQLSPLFSLISSLLAISLSVVAVLSFMTSYKQHSKVCINVNRNCMFWRSALCTLTVAWNWGTAWETEHTHTVCLSWYGRAWANSHTVYLCAPHTRGFIKHCRYFSPCFPAIVSASSDSPYTDSLLRLLLVRNAITNGAEFNQEREVWQRESGYCGVKVTRWGSFFMSGQI